MKKNIYFIQASNVLSGSVFLPYATGTLAAYAWQFQSIQDLCRPPEFVFYKEPINDVVSRVDNPFIAAFSNYMWNVEYNLSLAKEIKKSYPDTIIVFGGTQIPDDNEYLEKYGFIDILMHGEGEKTFYEMLSCLLKGESLENADNISFRKNNEIIKTKESIAESLDDFPSPYTGGYFDSILQDKRFEGIQLDAVIETNRGCPYQCAYCAWSIKQSKIRQFPIEKVRAEIDWIAKNKISFCFCADANFGILSRDEEIVDYLVETKKKFGYPMKFETTAAKNKNDLTFRINSKLNSVKLNRGVSLACQSMSENVLKNIGRQPIKLDEFKREVQRYRNSGIDTYTDLIIGLPGETAESFLNGVFNVMEAGQHNSINMYNCELLPNSILNEKRFKEKYKIKSVSSVLYQNHSLISQNEKLGSRSEIVVETDTMTKSDWLKIRCRSTIIQCFHCMGLLRYAVLYLRKAKKIQYSTFYNELFSWLEKDSVTVRSITDKITNQYEKFLNGNGDIMFKAEEFGNIYWPADEALFLYCLQDFDEFFNELDSFLCGFFDDKELYKDLIAYCKNIITRLDCPEKTVKLKYDWNSYFSDIYDETAVNPVRKDMRMVINNRNNVNSLQEYAKFIIWYGKRENKVMNRDVKFEII